MPRPRLPDEEGVLAFHLLYRKLELGIRQLKTESAGGLPYRVMSRQNPDLAEQDDIVGIIPSEIRFQVAAAPELEVVFKNIVRGSAHLVVLLRACVTRRQTLGRAWCRERGLQ